MCLCIYHCVKGVQIRSYFWSVFSCIQSEYRKMRTRNNSVFGHFSRNDIQRYIRNLVNHLRWNFSRNKLTDSWKAPIRCLTLIPSVKYFRKNLHLRCLTQISSIFAKSSIEVWNGFYLLTIFTKGCNLDV